MKKVWKKQRSVGGSLETKVAAAVHAVVGVVEVVEVVLDVVGEVVVRDAVAVARVRLVAPAPAAAPAESVAPVGQRGAHHQAGADVAQPAHHFAARVWRRNCGCRVAVLLRWCSFRHHFADLSVLGLDAAVTGGDRVRRRHLARYGR